MKGIFYQSLLGQHFINIDKVLAFFVYIRFFLTNKT